ncbi:MAG: alpha-E domain-containing protein [Acidimicrobiales bacterium]|jgi:uncharacterized alpha-E superfamily protein
MLSRIAESLFWVGRYLERADDTARLLDVETHRMLEGATANDLTLCRSLLSIMGLPAPADTELNFDQVTQWLAFDESQPSSIVSSLGQARENARGVRESIPSELWECLNATYVTLGQRTAGARAGGPRAYFGFARHVRERIAMAGGITDGAMSRDDGWRFLSLGKSIERVDMTARLLSVRLSQPDRLSDWVTTLRACSAYEAFLRTYRGRVSAARAVEFLLLDRLCPRSAYYALDSATNCLAEISRPRGQLGPADEAARILGRAHAVLEYQNIGELADDLPGHLLELQKTCSDVGAAIAQRYFQRDSTLAWRIEGDVGRELSMPA